MTPNSPPLPSASWRRFLIEAAAQANLELSCDHASAFEAYAQELLSWNRRINITTITDPAEIAVKHFVDSLIPASHIPPNAALLDIGSGGGFPGIPLALFRPDLRVTLVDASRKRVNFQRAVLRRLRLGNVVCIESKIEKLLQINNDRQAFDVIISRAFAAFERWIPEAVPLAKSEGRLIAMAGSIANIALTQMENAIHGIGIHCKCIPYLLPFHSSAESRNLLIVFL